jgi:hypothetical protein
MKDLHHNIKPVTTLLPVVTSTDKDGAAVDRQGFRSVEHIVHIGAPGDTFSGSVKFDFFIEESDNGTDWTGVTAADSILGQFTLGTNGLFLTVDGNAKCSKLYRIGYRGNKRYSRVTMDKTGTHTNGTPLSMSAIKGNPELAPTSEN